MYRGSRPRILPIIITIITVVVVIAILVTLVRSLLNPDKKTEQPQTPEQSLESKIKNQDPIRSVRWTVRGPIAADEEFKSYQITVSPTSRKYVIYSGYLDRVLDKKEYANNSNAYEQFTYALVKLNIQASDNKSNDDIRGVCATKGLAYVFETRDGDNTDTNLWTSTCKDSPGTLNADTLKLQALFVNQIPDFKPSFNNIF